MSTVQHDSSQHRRTPRVPLRVKAIGILVTLAVGAVVFGSLTGLQVTLLTFFTVVSLLNLCMSSLEVNWRMHTSRTPEAQQAMPFPEATTPEEAGISFALLVPALHEAKVIGRTLFDMAKATYHNVKIYVTLRHFDSDTIAAAVAVRERVDAYRRLGTNLSKGIKVVEHHYGAHEKGKPYQLNHALQVIEGEDFVGVMDAEDMVHPELLAHVAKTIQDNPDVDIVQSGVQLMNLDLHVPEDATWLQRKWLHIRGWFCLHNCMEYFFWFSSRMFYQVSQGVVPLGGNTVFIRRSLLEELGGWPTTLTEDCALGIRAAAYKKAKVIAIYDPRFVTKEETPSRLIIRRVKGNKAEKASTLVSQRCRWDQGFLEEFLAGHWRMLETRKERLIASYILGMPFIQAFNALMLPLSIFAAIWLVGPVPLVLFMFTPLVPLFMTLILQLIALFEFAKLYDKKLHLRHYLSLIIGFYPYQLVLGWAALVSIKRLLEGNNDWELTSHFGLHLKSDTAISPAAVETAATVIALEAQPEEGTA